MIKFIMFTFVFIFFVFWHMHYYILSPFLFLHVCTYPVYVCVLACVC